MTTKRVIVTGATGFIGRRVVAKLNEFGYQAVVFARDLMKAQEVAPKAAEYVHWTAAERGKWFDAVDGADAIINLAGAPVSGMPLVGPRWSKSYKRELRDSRILATRGLVNAIAAARNKPAVLVNGSAVGYYGNRKDEKLDESAAPGTDFLARLCVDWEAEALKAQELGVRVTNVRTGIVLDRDGGSLPILALPFRLFAGGPVLPGSQWFPWIHIDDEVGLLMLALEDDRVQGPLNAAAPEPVRQKEFASLVGRALKRPSLFPVPGFALRVLVGEGAQVLTSGQRVLPARALELGYRFQYPTAPEALAAIYARRPAGRRQAVAAH